jgi:long-chain-fatty-acyl-CoA reductase
MDRSPPHMRFPMVLDGSRLLPDSLQRLSFSEGSQDVFMPTFTDAVLGKLLAQDRHLLVDMPIQEITAFLNRVGKNWLSDDYPRRRLFVRHVQAAMGYSESAAKAAADLIGVTLSSHARMQDLIRHELGYRFILDRWVRCEETLVRAYPRGLVVHVLDSFDPLSSVYSVLQALLTKNLSVARVSGRDPVTALSLALSLIELDADHPVAHAVNVVSWPANDPVGDDLLSAADAVCVWGSDVEIDQVSSRTRATATFLPFGPQWSLALIGREADRELAAQGLACDVGAYSGCLSLRRVFVEGDAQRLVVSLERALARHNALLPRQRGSVPASVVVTAPDSDASIYHGHTVLVHPVETLGQVYRFLNDSTKTVAASPWELLYEHRDALARCGVSRFVEVGLTSFFRAGGTCAGKRPLQHLVRFVSHEAPAAVRTKRMLAPLDQMALLESDRLRELVF